MRVLFLWIVATISLHAWSTCDLVENLDHSSRVVMKGCEKQYCLHQVICDGVASLAICEAHGTECDGYNADDCKIGTDKISETAKYQETKKF